MAQVIGSIDPTKPVHIVGGGVSGLLIAFYLKKKKIPFTLYEKEPRVGGLIHTIHSDQGLLETAANALFTSDDVVELLRDLKLDYLPAKTKIRRMLVRNKAFLAFPFYWKEIPGLLLRFFFKKPPFQKGLSLKSFLLPLLGEKLCDEVVSTGLLGIYATDSAILDQESFFPYRAYSSYREAIKLFSQGRKKSMAKYHLRKSVSFQGGMQDLIDALEREVKEHIIHTEQKDLSSNTILCTNAPVAAKLLQKDHPELSKLLSKVGYQSIYTQTAFTDQEFKPLKGAFGVLFSRKTEFHSFGVLANHEIFPGRTTKGFSYTFIKKAANSGYEDYQEINFDCKSLYFPEIRESKSSLWPLGIPTYSAERRATMDEAKNYFHNRKISDLAIFGNYVDGISIRELISMAKNFCENF